MVEYTIDDIRGPTVAREMAQLKSFVLEKFNGAIADAEAAAAAAATAAANAVIGSLTTRVGALESDMTTAQGDIVTNANAILALDGSVVKLAGVQTITDVKNVPLEATGTASNQIANSQKVKNELDNYAPMLRTTGNFDRSGNLTQKFNAPASSGQANPFGIIFQAENMDISAILPSGNRYVFLPSLVDQNRQIIAGIRIQIASSGGGQIVVSLVTTGLDGNLKFKTLGNYNQTNGAWDA